MFQVLRVTTVEASTEAWVNGGDNASSDEVKFDWIKLHERVKDVRLKWDKIHQLDLESKVRANKVELHLETSQTH